MPTLVGVRAYTFRKLDSRAEWYRYAENNSADDYTGSANGDSLFWTVSALYQRRWQALVLEGLSSPASSSCSPPHQAETV